MDLDQSYDESQLYLISGLAEGQTVADFTAASQELWNSKGYTAVFTDPSGAAVSEEHPLATGDKVEFRSSEGSIVYVGTVILYGDINQDGMINILDGVALVQYLKNTAHPSDVAVIASDANRDQNVDILDGVAIVQYIKHSYTINQVF